MDAKAPTIDAVAELEAKNKALEAAAESLTAENEELRRKTEKAAPLPEVKIGKDSYRFTVQAFSLNGKRHTAIDAAKNKELLAELLEIGFGGLEPIV